MTGLSGVNMNVGSANVNQAAINSVSAISNVGIGNATVPSGSILK
jgi:hypothetical protein